MTKQESGSVLSLLQAAAEVDNRWDALQSEGQQTMSNFLAWYREQNDTFNKSKMLHVFKLEPGKKTFSGTSVKVVDREKTIFYEVGVEKIWGFLTGNVVAVQANYLLKKSQRGVDYVTQAFLLDPSMLAGAVEKEFALANEPLVRELLGVVRVASSQNFPVQWKPDQPR